MTVAARTRDPRGQGEAPPRTAPPTVSAGYARNLWAFARAEGAAEAELSARSDIAARDLEDVDARVPFSRYVALMRAAKALCGDPALALRLGAQQDFREFSVVGLICYAAPTMGQALAELNRFGRLVAEVDVPVEGGRFRLAADDDGLWLTDTRLDPDSFPEMTETTFSRFIAETARHFPQAPFARAVRVTHARPAHGDAYEQAFGAPVAFSSDRNAILIDASWLSIPLHNPSLYAFGVLSERAGALLKTLESACTVRGRVEALLIPDLHRGDMTMDAVAKRLGMSRRTLHRRLRDEGAGFDDLVDDLRRRMALHYLEGCKVSVNETAYLVGFSDPSAFSRAFRRWTGTRPGARRG